MAGVPIQDQPAVVEAYPPYGVTRRSFLLSSAGVAWVTFSVAFGAGMSTVLRFMLPNVLFEPPTTFKAGYPYEYAVGEVDERWKDKFGVWIVRTPEGLYALSTTCTHLGCIPNWLKNELKFKCPCHGSGFYATGVNFEGPAPRPLERFRITLDPNDGQIVVDKSKKFQHELGQWSDSEASLKA